ncbi:fructose-1,6-bisphosphate aldolase, class II [Mycoplasmopsis pullorum]|uniref:class II fructose-1,6-bisphosphate aldolase n=1 Tax=Mycoplasmopsis pullorum TaxID=48003 RepID=UPI00111AB92F|nr:class II fructose-1,6-bisphosphate aldolase [Mycoplasmopsis pullorum]TNK82103.1 fructose-1,6-bisphosphate aldolase, class II [Mycoplasmopsis pullorum]TNK83213.1 fructose-1,6-bisphosphate aldolase, class II [Mycoplasmopsis pullorum]TNK84349.1 fructose-1,6-bisphosphate aldolase, class II [Mycoplasmopsis pullorum]TNK85438.1 fructose-1,6-bisphosphate aldolase, class II [Mycoplasmopsis pullorum]TNK86187.1 fructose-1,6-bisphosphate aldolase, class II [Mycoplasmopsis pullorum]
MALVSAKEMLRKAKEGKYAIPHININNLEWAKAVLLTAQAEQSPIIIATSEGALKYMGGFDVVAGMVTGLIKDLNITVPVALHLDHGSYEGALKAIENEAYTSIMFDGSHFPFEENYAKTAELVKLAAAKGMSVEAEVGTIGGEEDGIVGNGEFADPAEAKKMAQLGIDVLAAGIGNIHGPYPSSWKSLSFETLKEISEAAGIGIVLHGGSGIPLDQIQKAISLGITKINVNTELQQANHAALRKYIESGKDLEGKNFDPRKLYKPGYDAMCETVKQKIHEFGSNGKAFE